MMMATIQGCAPVYPVSGGYFMKVIIDRFEGSYAVCEKEDRQMIDIERGALPPEAKEGDVLDIEGDRIVIDNDETIKRRKRIEELTRDLWK
jgi:hypothetical protein